MFLSRSSDCPKKASWNLCDARYCSMRTLASRAHDPTHFKRQCTRKAKTVLGTHPTCDKRNVSGFATDSLEGRTFVMQVVARR